MKKLIVTVKKVEYATDGFGVVQAIVRLTKEHTYKKLSFDSLVMDSVFTVFKNNLQRGSKIHVDVTKDGKIYITKYKDPKVLKQVELPYRCTTCDSKLYHTKESLIVCNNLYCKSSNRAGIYILLDKLIEDKNLITSYLDNFPLTNSTVKINNLIEYLTHFKSVGMKNTETREKMFERLKGINKKESYDLVIMERKLEEILLKKQDNSFYWNILNVPNFTLNELVKFNPSNVTNLQIKQLKSKTKRDTLINGDKYFKLIMKLFKSIRG